MPYKTGNPCTARQDGYLFRKIPSTVVRVSVKHEFSPQASLGFRYLIGKRWSLDAEGIFHHISNAGLDGEDRNVGTNAFGGLIGVTYFFGPSARGSDFHQYARKFVRRQPPS